MTRNKISWCLGPDGAPGFSWNVTGGCSPVSAGCAHCWASRLASTRLAHRPEYAGLAKDGTWLGHARFFADRLAEPLRRKKPSGIVVSLMGDLFHKDITFDDIVAVFGVMSCSPQHRFYVLTKRAKRMREVLSHPEMIGAAHLGDTPWPLPHVFVGASIEDQATADERIPELLQTPAAVRFVSYEPALGPVTFGQPEVSDPPEENPSHALANPKEWDDWKYWAARDRGIQWCIMGAESGPGARPMQDDWVRSIRDQCQSAGVAFFFKQAMRNGRLDHEPMLDGRTWRQIPVRKT